MFIDALCEPKFRGIVHVDLYYYRNFSRGARRWPIGVALAPIAPLKNPGALATMRQYFLVDASSKEFCAFCACGNIKMVIIDKSSHFRYIHDTSTFNHNPIHILHYRLIEKVVVSIICSPSAALNK